MKTARYNEVPKSYRRNYKKEFVEILKMLGISLGLVLFFVWMCWMA